MTTQPHVAEVLFFTSPHCTQCAAARPAAVDVASTFNGEVRFREIDTSTNSQETRRHSVRGVPTVIAIRDDEVLGRFVGARSREEIAGMFAFVSAGERTRQTISQSDRTLRLGVAAAFGIAAVATGSPVLWVFAAGAAFFGVWDLIRP
jgi:thioredoxin-like negative regulator of GroEL